MKERERQSDTQSQRESWVIQLYHRHRLSGHCLAVACGPHQARVGVVEPVVQREALQRLEERGMVEAAGVGRDELVHAVLLRPVCVCSQRKRGV